MMEIEEIVMKLIGPVHALGEHSGDMRRLENMKKLTDLVDKLLFTISQEVPNADRVEYSMKAIGEHAREFLKDVKSADII